MKLKFYEFIAIVLGNVLLLFGKNFVETKLFWWVLEKMRVESERQLDCLIKEIDNRIDYLLEGRDLKGGE